MGHTLILWSVSLLACPSEGQIGMPPPATPCASCQAAQQMQMQMPSPAPLPMPTPMAMQYQEPAPPPPRGLFGLGLWDRIWHRHEDVDARPGLFARWRSNSWFARSRQPEGGSSLGEPGYFPMASAAPCFNDDPSMVFSAAGEPSPSRMVTVEPPINQPPANRLPTIGVAHIEPPMNQPSTIPASYRGEPAPVPVNRVPIDPNNANMGHESDYSWVTGRILFVQGESFIQYAQPGAVDRFGGRLKLVNVDTSSLRDGDFVCVSGALMSSNGQIIGAYRVTNISLFERGK